jgi:hypothetical protein
MVNAVTVARGRATVTTFRDADPRTNRPNDAALKVKAGPNAPALPGLIQKRGGSGGTAVTVYPVSGTSVTAENINALTTANELYKMLYLLRQEIFFLEGRRMSDLGIRLPVSIRQIQTNSNVPDGSPGTVTVVPAYIPNAGNDLDRFTIDAAAGEVTIATDMNQLIADNINSVSPFLR